jgi:hypothetical protein
MSDHDDDDEGEAVKSAAEPRKLARMINDGACDWRLLYYNVPRSKPSQSDEMICNDFPSITFIWCTSNSFSLRNPISPISSI